MRSGSTDWRKIFSARPGPDLGFTRNRTGFSGGEVNAAIESEDMPQISVSASRNF